VFTFPWLCQISVCVQIKYIIYIYIYYYIYLYIHIHYIYTYILYVYIYYIYYIYVYINIYYVLIEGRYCICTFLCSFNWVRICYNWLLSLISVFSSVGSLLWAFHFYSETLEMINVWRDRIILDMVNLDHDWAAQLPWASEEAAHNGGKQVAWQNWSLYAQGI
jgi:hypothetical protein